MGSLCEVVCWCAVVQWISLFRIVVNCELERLGQRAVNQEGEISLTEAIRNQKRGNNNNFSFSLCVICALANVLQRDAMVSNA